MKKRSMMFKDRHLPGAAFEKFADNYGQVRPGYPREIFTDLAKECGVVSGTSILEIGAGTGIATRSLLELGASVVAVEPGENLLEIARESLVDFTTVEFVGTTFEQYQERRIFDMVVSATAFHWLGAGDKFTRVASLLKPGGHLVVMWNSFCQNNDPIEQEIAVLYGQHLPDVYPEKGDVNAGVLQKSLGKEQEIADSGIFYIHTMRRYLQHCHYDTKHYVALLNTFPKIIEAPEKAKQSFLRDVEAVVEKHGQIIVPVLTTVCVCRRKQDFSSFIHQT